MKNILYKIMKHFLAGLTFLSTFLSVIDPAYAQLSIDFGDATGDNTGRLLQIIALITVLSVAPGILIMMTSFTRIVIVFSFLRTAMGTQQSPPNMVLVSLAMFLTAFIMTPTFKAAWETAISPMVNNEMDEKEAFEKAVVPFKKFMLANTREKDLMLFVGLSEQKQEVEDLQQLALPIIIPSFMISELRRAFEIGFLIFLPFLIIDMVVASILMSMGMMMVPPVMIALPFKVIFFVLVDGWYLISGSLIQSFNSG